MSMKDEAAREFLSYISTEARRLRRVDRVERMIVPCALIETLCNEVHDSPRELSRGTRDKLFALQCGLLSEKTSDVLESMSKVLEGAKRVQAKQEKA